MSSGKVVEHELVIIEWEDIESSDSWKSKSETESWTDKTTHLVTEVGWIIKETKKFLVLASQISENDIGNSTKILKSVIKSRKIIKQ